VRGGRARERIGGALARVGLADRAGDRVGTYSQGMRQRLGIARCLLADPELLILDEPMNGLDPGGILELRGLIADLVAEGRTVFISSHLIGEIEKTCHAAAVIDCGRLIAQGPIAALLGDGGSSLEDWFLTLTSRIGARS
jgi:ABC-2 type transport system ATP-binding protein